MPEGRHFVADQLRAWGAADRDRTALEDVLLAVSELVGNAVRHGWGDLALDLAAHRDEVAIEVRDGARAEAVPRTAGPEEEGGRGLALVATLATGWGQRRTDTGKAVWATFALPAGSALGEGCRR